MTSDGGFEETDFLHVRYPLKWPKETEVGRINMNMKALRLVVMKDIQSL